MGANAWNDAFAKIPATSEVVTMSDINMDREKSIKALSICDWNGEGKNCGECPYADERWHGARIDGGTDCIEEMRKDLLEILEPKKPVSINGLRFYICGQCGNGLWVAGQRYCGCCGTKVGWDIK